MSDYKTLKEIIDEIDTLMHIDDLDTLSSLFDGWHKKTKSFISSNYKKKYNDFLDIRFCPILLSADSPRQELEREIIEAYRDGLQAAKNFLKKFLTEMQEKNLDNPKTTSDYISNPMMKRSEDHTN